MDFRELAAKETSELAARLAKAATAAATAAAEQAAKQVGDEAQKVADALRTQLQTAVDQKTAVAASLKDAQTQAERLRGELKSTTERVEVASRKLDEARKAAEKLEAARVELGAARDEQAAARRTAETDLRKVREAADSLRTELSAATKALEKAGAERRASDEAAASANSQSQAAEAKLAAVTDLLKKQAGRVTTLEQAHQEHERTVKDLESKLQGARSAPAPASSSAPVLEELLAGFQALGTATTIADVLATLVEQLAGQFPRVALFRVKKGHLQGEHQIGFDLKTDIAKLMLPLGMDSLPARAASSGQLESLGGEELKSSGTPFNGTPGCAIALPLVVAGETLAIVYADDSGAPKRGRGADEQHTRCAEAMRQYAIAVLLRLTNELKALAELRKYATSLLHEMEQMYDADVEAGVTAGDLQKRLAGNLDYARSIYGSRTALESPDAATLIDDELASLVDARSGSGFAADLAAAAGLPGNRSAAEAS